MRHASEATNGIRGRRDASARSVALGSTASSHDEIAVLFRDLRRALKLSLPEIASRVGTRIEIVTALEKGDFRKLPQWPETVRVVTAYTGLAKIDPRPVLRVLRDHLDVPIVARTSRAGATEAVSRFKSLVSRAGGAARRGLAASGQRHAAKAGAMGSSLLRSHAAALRRTSIAACVALALSLGTYYVRSGGLQASIAALPPPLAEAARGAEDFILWQTAPTREGLRWIDVDDPRARRSDRLDIGRR
jgi:hypothetical protein